MAAYSNGWVVRNERVNRGAQRKGESMREKTLRHGKHRSPGDMVMSSITAAEPGDMVLTLGAGSVFLLLLAVRHAFAIMVNLWQGKNATPGCNLPGLCECEGDNAK
jgi:hypothetical protein